MRLINRVWFVFLISINFYAYGQNEAEAVLKKKIALEKSPDKKSILYNRAAEEILNADPEKSQEYALLAISFAKKAGNKVLEADGMRSYGMALYYVDEFEKGIKEIKKALSIYKEKKLDEKEGIALNGIGEIYVYWSKYDDALDYLSKARHFLEVSNNKTDLARCYNNLGIIHKSQFDAEEALVFFNRAYKIGDDIRKGDASLYMGEVYLSQQRFSDAESSLNKAVSLAEKNEDNYVLADAEIALAKVKSFYGKTNDAMQLYLSALAIKEEVADQQGQATVSTGIGNLYLLLNKPLEAHNWFMKSARIAAKINTREQLRQAYLGLSNTFHLQEVDDSAYIFLRLYNKISHDILSADASKKLASLEKALEADKRKQKAKNDRLVNRIYMIAGSIMILFFIVLAYVMYNRYKLKKKSNEEIMRQKDALELQKIIIEEKNREITDSINYARRIQLAMLSDEKVVKNYFKESFILFKPKDIVSGDFFWFVEKGDVLIYATADCTGHGVPGGFMSMLSVSLLNEIVIEQNILNPGKILDTLRDKIIGAMRQTGAEGENKDGMDIVLMAFDKNSNKLQYAAANNGFYIVKNSEVNFYKPHKQPVGYFAFGMTPFPTTEIQLEKGDKVYTFTDGFADQFGGPRGKKYKYKQLEEILVAIHKMPMHEQKEIMDAKIVEWQGDLEQNDDICLLGVGI